MYPLKVYLKAIGASNEVFARALGISTQKLDEILSGRRLLEPSLARRIVAAAGDALTLNDLYPSGAAAPSIDIVDMTAAVARDADDDINADRLRMALKDQFKQAGYVIADGFLDAACEAVENTYAALATVTTRHGPDRLFQALRPVLGEILEDFSGTERGDQHAPHQSPHGLDQMTTKILALYFQAP